MKTIIAGSRSIIDINQVIFAVHDSGFLPDITEIVSGGAPGIDRLAIDYAKTNHIPCKTMPANWDKYGKRMAGLVRNGEMAQYADALIAIWDGRSRGTYHMIETAQRLNLKVFIYKVKNA